MPDFTVPVRATVYVTAENEFEARRVVQQCWATHRAAGVSALGRWEAEGVEAFAEEAQPCRITVAAPPGQAPMRIMMPPPSRRAAAEPEAEELELF